MILCILIETVWSLHLLLLSQCGKLRPCEKIRVTFILTHRQYTMECLFLDQFSEFE